MIFSRLTELRPLESGLRELPLLLPLWTLPRPRCIRKVSLCSSNLHRNKNCIALLRRRSIITFASGTTKLACKKTFFFLAERKFNDADVEKMWKNTFQCRIIYLQLFVQGDVNEKLTLPYNTL